MKKTIRFADFECLLLRLGFHRGVTTGKHFLFENPPHNALIMLPPYEDEEMVRDLHLISARKLITDRGIVDEEQFDRMLNEATVTPDCAPVA